MVRMAASICSMGRLRLMAHWCGILILGLAFTQPASSYSLLTHEQMIDLTWDDAIVPLLLSHFPNATRDQLEQARAYAYGGSVIQDIGYYPFGEASFSNLTHYVRSGDFVVNLFRDAQDLNELAFAVGALSHYIGDSIGHPLATNVAVPIEFPKLRMRFGRYVDYAEGKHQHVQVEFAFDVDEDAHHRTAPIKYLRHIGLQISMRQLSSAYYQTYGISANFSGSRGRRVNEKAYRFAVRSFIPAIADALVLIHHNHEPAEIDTPEARALRSEIAAMASANNWARYQSKPGIRLWLLAGIIRIMPKIGPLKLAAVKGPTSQAEADYQHSLALSTAAMRRMLWRFTPPDKRRPPPHLPGREGQVEQPSSELSRSGRAREVSQMRMDPRHPLPNRDLDTGNEVHPGSYPLTDETYADLLRMLASQPNLTIPPGIKEDIQAYYANPEAPNTTKKNPQRWSQVQKDLVTLSAMPTSPIPQEIPTYEAGTDESQ
ncbi:hypothetical protein DYQ86_10260 [Acidobacteria bacterium AB60]|nr:hypothetical protein DYQ86_10260 [Acidobacteria bacterium AB60]